MDDRDAYGIEVKEFGDIYIKQMFVPRRQTWLPQHSHVWPHLTMLTRGSVFVWKDGVLDKQYRAPAAIEIHAGVKHLFLTCEDNTELWCVHSLHGHPEVEVLDPHEIVSKVTFQVAEGPVTSQVAERPVA